MADDQVDPAVAGDVALVERDGPVHLPDHVLVPAAVLVPGDHTVDEARCDQVGTPVAVDVDGLDPVAVGEPGFEDLGVEARLRAHIPAISLRCSRALIA